MAYVSNKDFLKFFSSDEFKIQSEMGRNVIQKSLTSFALNILGKKSEFFLNPEKKISPLKKSLYSLFDSLAEQSLFSDNENQETYSQPPSSFSSKKTTTMKPVFNNIENLNELSQFSLDSKQNLKNIDDAKKIWKNSLYNDSINSVYKKCIDQSFVYVDRIKEQAKLSFIDTALKTGLVFSGVFTALLAFGGLSTVCLVSGCAFVSLGLMKTVKDMYKKQMNESYAASIIENIARASNLELDEKVDAKNLSKKVHVKLQLYPTATIQQYEGGY